ncbi:hypothetical protein PGB90_005847 [Kerria lacca]
MVVVPQPFFTPPILTPCDFWLFPQMKNVLQGNRFQSIEEIQETTIASLRDIPPANFTKCF